MSVLVRLSGALLALAAAAPAAAQVAESTATPLSDALSLPEGFSLKGSIRLRYEFIDGQPRAGFNSADDLFSLRTVVSARYDAGWIGFGADLFDSRSYFADAGTPLSTSDVNSLELVSAFVKLRARDVLGDGTSASLTLGRQIVPFGSKRLLGAEDYRNTLNAYVGARADVTFSKDAVASLFYLLPQIRRPDGFDDLSANRVGFDGQNFDTQVFGAFYAAPNPLFDGKIEAIAVRFIERDRPEMATRDRRLTTAGLRAFRDPAPGKAAYDVEGFWQTGTVSATAAPAAPALDVSAWFLHAEAGYQWDTPIKPYLAVEFDHATGDGPEARFTRFDTLFGMRRTDFAPAGLFNAIGRANTTSLGVRFETAPSKRFDTLLAWRALWLASPTDAFSTTGVRDPSGLSGDFGGHLLDARARWWVKPGILRLEADYIYLAKGRFLETAPNASSPIDTRYLSLNLTGFF